MIQDAPSRPARVRAAPLARALAALAAATPLAAFAQAADLAPGDDAAPGDAPRMAPVVVSASRNQTRVEDMPLHTTVIGRDEILAAPARTLDQLLRAVPGFNFTGVPAHQSDPTGQQTRMRGLGNAKVLVLLDGVPIHDPFYLTTQWFKIPLFSIERVEVIRGGNSSLWGNMAVAGVVNVVTRRPADGSGEALASAGRFGMSELAASRDFALSDTLGVTLGIDRFDTDGYQQTPAEWLWRFPAKGPTAATNTNVRMSARWRPSDTTRGYLRLGWHEQDQDIGYRFGRNLQRSPDLAAGLGTTLGAWGRIDASAWAQRVDFTKFNGASCWWQASGTACPGSAAVTPAQAQGDVVQYYSQRGVQDYGERGGWVAWSTVPRGLLSSVQVGADWRRLEAEDREWFYAPPTTLAALQNLSASTVGEGRQTFQGVFSQARLVPVGPVEITLSARHDRWRNDERFVARTSAAGVNTGGAVPASEKSAINPAIAARWDAADGVALRAAAYRSFRAPGFNNMIRTFGTGTNTTIANPDLEPETLHGREFGIDLGGSPLALGLTWFEYDIRDMIATYTVRANGAAVPDPVARICGAPAGGAFPGCAGATSVRFYTNDQDGRSRGIEFVGRWQPAPALALDASWTRTDTVLTRRGAIVTDPVGMQLAGVPRDIARVGLGWRPVERLRTRVEARWIGPMPVDTTSTPGTTHEQAGVTVFDASASWALDKRVDLYAAAVNLADRRYSENAYTITQPWNRTLSMPRSISAGVRLRF